MQTPLITNDAVTFGILATMLALVLKTAASSHPFFKKLYTFVPTLLLFYFLPSLLTTFGLVDPNQSKLYFVASRYMLPASLVLLTLSTDLKGILRLGPKALIMFLTGTFGVIVGGPLAFMIISFISPETIATAGNDSIWRGLGTIAGSWIGGAANMTALKEVFQVDPKLFSQMVTIDVVIGSLWFGILLFAAGRANTIDAKFKADTTAIETLKEKLQAFHEKHTKIPNLSDLMSLCGVAFGVTAASHYGAELLAPWFKENAPYLSRFSFTSDFFWVVVLATTGGLILSFTKARKMEGVGASRLGSLFLYFLIATLGMQMNILSIFDNPGLILLGAIWMSIHGLLILLVAKLIRAPLFFSAVGSMANIGAAASAPIIASAFHPTLASVGVMLAVLGYVLGTYGGWLCAQIMRILSNGA